MRVDSRNDYAHPMNQAWIPVISGAVGAGGAVIAQVVSAIFTARRESKKLRWDKTVLEREWKHRTLERFDEVKTKVYAEFLSLLYSTTLDILTARPRDLDKLPPESKSKHRARQDMPSRMDKNYYAIMHHKNQIGILSLQVGEYAQNAFRTYARFLDSLRNTDMTYSEYFELYGDAIKAESRLRKVMRQDLAGEEIEPAEPLPMKVDGGEQQA